MSDRKGATWDRCKIILEDASEIVGYLDTSWGQYFYFQHGGSWRKAKIMHHMNGRENDVDFRIPISK